MERYSVKKNGRDFTVYVNNDYYYDDVSSAGSCYEEGDIITEILIDYENIPVLYGGIDESTGWHIIRFTGKKRVLLSPQTQINTGNILRLCAKLFDRNVYSVELLNGRIFFEACNDMSEKKELYKELSKKVTCEVRYKSTPGETPIDYSIDF